MKKKVVRRFLWASFGLLICGATVGAWFLLWIFTTLPSVENISSRQVSQSTKIYDREGKALLYEVSGDQRRTVIPFEDIPEDLRGAVIAIEDEKFYEEPGISIRGILRAFFANLMAGEIVQGGSTITQQLARNAFLSADQTLMRKLRELFLALQIDRRLTKNQILALYLNEIPFGSTLYGVESASQAFFGKSTKDLSLAESALLAAIPKAPTYYSPWGTHVKELLNRQQLVLKRMVDTKKISEAEYKDAVSTQLSFKSQSTGILAPHFVTAVQDYLVKKYGEDTVRTGGLVVKTTLDVELQQAAEKAVKEGATQNTELYAGHNAALVAMDPKSGEVLALVGSKDFFGKPQPEGCTPGLNCGFEPSYNVATQALRQPGSALKPFAYLTAFKKGYTPEAVLFDVPTEFVPRDPPCPIIPDFTRETTKETEVCFHPRNFDNIFRGPVAMNKALAQSINVPAVKTLYLAGLQNTMHTLWDFGVTTLNDPHRFGLSLVLGGGEVKLIELAGAYSVLAADGIYREPHLILEAVGRDGSVLESYGSSGERVVEEKFVRMINEILSDTDLRAGLFSSSLPLTVFEGHDVALKTGTTNDYRDAWAMGYTPSLVAGVWAGNNDNKPMQRRGSSILAAVPIWSAFMKQALKESASESFPRPERETPSKPILAGDYSFGGQIHSILYHVNKDDPAGPPPANPSSDPQFENWETSVLSWAGLNLPNFYAYNQSSSPLFFGSSTQDSLGSLLPRIEIRSPAPGSQVGPFISVDADISSVSNLSLITVYFNGSPVHQVGGINSNSYALRWSFVPQGTIGTQNNFEIEAQDVGGLRSRSGSVLYP